MTFEFVNFGTSSYYSLLAFDIGNRSPPSLNQSIWISCGQASVRYNLPSEELFVSGSGIPSEYVVGPELDCGMFTCRSRIYESQEPTLPLTERTWTCRATAVRSSRSHSTSFLFQYSICHVAQ